jgi:hypothetical protein
MTDALTMKTASFDAELAVSICPVFFVRKTNLGDKPKAQAYLRCILLF